MGFVAPAALGLLGLLGAVALLHMLRVERRDQVVGSTLLWQSLVQTDPPADRPWRPLRRSLLLALQLAFLLAAVFALARPFLPSGGYVGRSLIVLVDRSASMGATEAGSTRLEAAASEVLDLIDSAVNPRVTLVAFDQDMEVLASGESDRAAIARAFGAIEPRPLAADAEGPLAFASGLAAGMPDAQIVVATDGGIAVPDDLALPAPVRVIRVGAEADNAAIRTVNVSRQSPGEPAELFVALEAFADEPQTRRLEVRAGSMPAAEQADSLERLVGRERGGRSDLPLLDARDVALPPRGEAAFTLALPPEADLVEVSFSEGDDLAADDRAWAVASAIGRTSVNLVSPGNRFLETAFTLLPGVGAVNTFGLDAAGFSRADISVVDGAVPARLPPGALLLVRPDGTPGVDIAGVLEAPALESTRPDHPLVLGLDLESVSVLEAVAYTLGPEWLPVVVAEVDGRQWPVLAAGRLQGVPAVLLAFDVRQSDLPLRPEFPLLVANIVEFLAPSGIHGVPSELAPGQPVAFRIPEGAADVYVEGPFGRESLAVRDGEAVFADSHTPGFYVFGYSMDGELRRAITAVNMSAVSEANLAPRALPSLTAAAADPAGQSVGRREVWEVLAWLGLVLVCAEWAAYHPTPLRRLRESYLAPRIRAWRKRGALRDRPWREALRDRSWREALRDRSWREALRDRPWRDALRARRKR